MAKARSRKSPPRTAVRAGTGASAGGSRATRQARLRAQLVGYGLELCRKHGFDATTVSDIAEAAGISRRTFFRYFDSKDDVVFDWVREQGAILRPLLMARPAGEPSMQALVSVYLALTRHYDEDRARSVAVTRIVFDTPSLSRRYLDENTRWEDDIARILEHGQRIGKNEAFATRVLISSVTAAFTMAMRGWAANNHTGTLLTWVERAFAALESGLDQLRAPASGARVRAAKGRKR